MKFNIITAFTEFYNSFLNTSLVKKGLEKNIFEVNLIDLKKYGEGSYNKIDDTPYGGGPGMVLKPDVIYKALKEVEEKTFKIALTPKGEIYNQKLAVEYSKKKNITFVCGRYEGFDERIFKYIDKKVSIGEYVTLGGESPSLVIIESIVRLLPDVIGKAGSIVEESYSNGIIKEYPIYTKPYNFKGDKVPDVLISGNHKEIKKWRTENTVFN